MAAARRRLDAELVRRGLVTSRTEAQAAVRQGLVVVGGRPAVKASTLVAPAEPVELMGSPRRFASRAGEKLDAALDRFAIDASGRRCLDAGASTGGFTDCLLQRGAYHVVSVDVGYGQLAWRLRTDPRVSVLDRTNVRELAADDLPYAPDLVVADLSFISLRLVVPTLAGLAAGGADLVLLVKPQFEVGRAHVGRGVVRDPESRRRAIERSRGRRCGGGAGAARRDGLADARASGQRRVPAPRGERRGGAAARRGRRAGGGGTARREVAGVSRVAFVVHPVAPALARRRTRSVRGSVGGTWSRGAGRDVGARASFTDGVDLVVSVGGDGTLLRGRLGRRGSGRADPRREGGADGLPDGGRAEGRAVVLDAFLDGRARIEERMAGSANTKVPGARSGR